jgi:hypothetical protein
MAAKPKRRPVSGEIMTGAAIGTSRAPLDVVNAELLESATTAGMSRPAFATTRTATGLTMLSRAMEPPTSRRAGTLFWIGGVALAVSAFWLSGGHALVAARLPTIPGGQMVIAHVETLIDGSAGRTTLVVDGEAKNTGSNMQTMPPIAIAVTGHDGTITRYTLSAGNSPVAAGETYLFSSRLRVPPEGVKSVAVTLQPVD